MQREIGRLNRRRRDQDPAAPALSVRIGLNTGRAVVGNVGGEDRFDYSAIGDPVNLAARLEPANKSYGTRTMASQLTLEAADRGAYRVRELDLVAVKGRREPVKVFEILGVSGEPLEP
ncbi:MAG: adenylate/guanylate cyclase domain-containing protein, partial [Gemmatimonadetes bacterium]|nr:adenylate/guanylate cyclase domain-containing protein [Gemmatimonadota bacterium]NIR79659.1 adenylate/guanylate cyclase domain-containing protein [Gemmatimonadota bacterium]NIT88366.1 adenylate/guanylate cyclase domain-containing protein [Gemmatimonadota bacterium]NIU32175.1 adenylate/guanylate cyclase domain-containing protein [Gemmatimonadota bacterium]NIU36731.1 adenylate/guanylate cyclase domain-containing protein [Gemmatimonadota bacterium]